MVKRTIHGWRMRIWIAASNGNRHATSRKQPYFHLFPCPTNLAIPHNSSTPIFTSKGSLCAPACGKVPQDLDGPQSSRQKPLNQWQLPPNQSTAQSPFFCLNSIIAPSAGKQVPCRRHQCQLSSSGSGRSITNCNVNAYENCPT